MNETRFARLHLALLVACLFYAVLGLAVAFGGEALFGLWRSLVAEALYGDPDFPESLTGFARLTDGILGGSIAGKWIATAWVVHVPLRRRARWAAQLVLASLLTWFVIDSTTSVMNGAWINVLVINTFPLIVVGGLTLALYPSTVVQPREPRSSRTWQVLTWVCAISVLVGFAAAVAIRSAPFAPYNQGIADLYFASATQGDWVIWQTFTFGVIGGTIAGHFVALTGVLRFARDRRWALHAVVTSMLVWFLVDTTVSGMEGAWFNVLMVNVPSLVMVLVPALIAWRSARE